MVYDNAPNQKFVFTGSTAADLGNPAKWSYSSADTAGAVPPTLGNVDSAFYAAVASRSLSLPCCSNADTGGRSSSQPAPQKHVVSNSGRIKVYPNPADRTLYFEFSASGAVNIRITDITGRTMAEQTIRNSGSAVFDVSSYAPGLYIYQVITNGKTQSGKIVIGK